MIFNLIKIKMDLDSLKDLHNLHCDINNPLNNNSSKSGMEIANSNKSTSTKVQEQNKTVNLKIVDINDVQISKQRVPLNIPYVINATKKNENNIFLRPKIFSSNLENISASKAVISNVKNIPSFMSSQIKKSPTTSIIPAATLIKPITTINTSLQPKVNPAKVPNNKCISTLNPIVKVISSNDSKSGMCILPKVNYTLKTIKKDDVKNQALNSIIPISVAEKSNTIEKREIKNEKTKCVLTMEEFQNQRFQVLRREENICTGKDSNLFNSTIHFQLIYKHSSKLFVRSKKRSLKPHTDSPNPKVIKIANTSESKQIEQEKELLFKTSSMNKITNSTDFGIRSDEKKLIPHTITSKDVIDNNPKVVIENYKTKLDNNVKKVVCPTSGFIQPSSRPEAIVKTYGRPLTFGKYGNSSSNELNTVRLVPLSSINQSKTKLNTKIPGNDKHLFITILKNNGSTSNSTIAKVSTDKIMKEIPSKIYASKNPQIKIAPKENQKKVSLEKPIQFLLPKEIIQEKHNPYYGDKLTLIRCEYEYCQTIVNELDLINKLYCCESCKNLDTKLKLATKSHVIEEPQEESLKKPVIDQKLTLAKLKSKINKRKQCSPSMLEENKALHVDLSLVEKPHKETCKMQPPIPIPMPLTVKRTFKKSQNIRNSSYVNGKVVQNDKLDYASLLKVISIYLQHTDYIPAPKNLFDNPFPSDCNPFKVGQRLEGIDPEHEALYCVMSVIEVVGYRIKLHFDGYSCMYDFWVNANCPDLFYARWCDENSRTLQPPKSYKLPFNWTDYLRMPGVTPAPKWNFFSAIYLNHNTDHSFYIGGKLEALDKLTRTLPEQLIRVATVADILKSRIRIHFDGLTDDFDYWTDITSTNIHPVGWCDKNERTLCPPSGYDDLRGEKPFSWTQYLKETNSEPVPEDMFIRRPLREFTNSMAIEVVDIANPSLVRIAKVVDVRRDELKILYDGFDTMYAYWIEDDSPNIHPLGWCLSTAHPIELFQVNSVLWCCRVPGCNGKGNKQSSLNSHVLAKDCPYEFELWKTRISGLTHLPDRLKPNDIPVSVASCSKSISIVPQGDKRNEKKKKQKSKLHTTKSYNFNKPQKTTINKKLKKNQKEKPKGPSKTIYTRAVEEMEKIEIIKNVNDYTSYGYGSFNPPRFNVWNRHNALEGIPISNTSDVRKWPAQEVATFVEKVVSNNHTDDNPSYGFIISNAFRNLEIGGDVFLMLTQKDLMDKLHIPLGPALKLHNAIVVLRQRTFGFDVANGVITEKKK